MTQEDKQLLIKDLCMRLPYGVMFSVFGKDEELVELSRVIAFVNGGTLNDKYALQHCKPYLRPMSSMTEEEIHEFQEILGPDIEVGYGFMDILVSSIHTFSFNELQALFDWLNANHFDFRGLIEKGLAIAVTKDNNPYR